jgi:hypothetical protein
MQHIVRTVYLRISICLDLQRALRSRRFADEEEVKKVVHDWLRALTKEFLCFQKACGQLDKVR